MLLDISNTLYESLDLIGQWITGRGREKETRSKATVGTTTDNHISSISEGTGPLTTCSDGVPHLQREGGILKAVHILSHMGLGEMEDEKGLMEGNCNAGESM